MVTISEALAAQALRTLSVVMIVRYTCSLRHRVVYSAVGDSEERCACCRSRLNRTAAKEKSDSQITNDAVYFEICSLISTLGQNGNHYRIIAFLMTYSTNRLDTGDVKWGRIRNGQ